MKIYKYQFDLAENATVDMVYPGEIVSVMDELDGNRITLYATAYDVGVDTRKTDLVIAGTGQDFNPDGLEFLQTIKAGYFRWHLFVKV